MSESDDRSDRVELHGMAPRRIVDLLDAVSCSRRLSRQDILVQVLTKWADEITHEALSIVRVSGANGSPTDGERKVDGK
jgi:hypothetical protein